MNRNTEAENETRLKQAVRAVKLGFWDYDILNESITWSAESMRMWGVNSEQSTKKELYEKIFPEDAPLLTEAFEKALEHNGHYFVQHRILRGPEDLIWIESQGDCVFAGKRPIRVMGTSIEITERKNAETTLRLAKEAAECANAAKSQFLANMSHEIRTPLGAIMGFGNLLQNQHLDRDTVKKYLSVIERNSAQLLRIVDDILDLSKVEAGRMLIEKIEFPFLELLSDIALLMKHRAEENGIVFALVPKGPLPTHILSDPIRIRQILGNIVGNAIKFTHRGSVILEISYATGQLNFLILDTGIGLTPEQQNKIFIPFSQADASTTRTFGGTGLGLTLTRKLCEALGGEFTLLETEIGKGSKFLASIRIEVPETAQFIQPKRISFDHSEAVTSEKEKLRLKELCILLIEDSPDNREWIEILLTQAGAKVDLANNGRDGIQKAFARPYDIILMDIQMPEMDGHEAAKLLRQQHYRGPIIALTAHAMKQEQEKCIRSGFNHFLSKPVHHESLFSSIERLLARDELETAFHPPMINQPDTAKSSLMH